MRVWSSKTFAPDEAGVNVEGRWERKMNFVSFRAKTGKGVQEEGVVLMLTL